MVWRVFCSYPVLMDCLGSLYAIYVDVVFNFYLTMHLSKNFLDLKLSQFYLWPVMIFL